MDKLLNGLERIGNKLPHPFILFIVLAGLVAISSFFLSLFGVTAVNPQTKELV